MRDQPMRQAMRNVCRKFLGYALGRGLIPSDDALIDQLMADLEANGWRPSSLIAGVLTSPQFTQRRDEVAAAAAPERP